MISGGGFDESGQKKTDKPLYSYSVDRFYVYLSKNPASFLVKKAPGKDVRFSGLIEKL